MKIGDRVQYLATAHKNRRNMTSYTAHDGVRHVVVATVWMRKERLGKPIRDGVFLGWTTIHDGKYVCRVGQRTLVTDFETTNTMRCAVVQPTPDKGARFRRPVYVFEDDMEFVRPILVDDVELVND